MLGVENEDFRICVFTMCFPMPGSGCCWMGCTPSLYCANHSLVVGCAVPEDLDLFFFLSFQERHFWIPLLILSICSLQCGAEVRRKPSPLLERGIAARGLCKNPIMCRNIKLYELLFSCLLISRKAQLRLELRRNAGSAAHPLGSPAKSSSPSSSSSFFVLLVM